jgi:hypothetical protein
MQGLSRFVFAARVCGRYLAAGQSIVQRIRRLWRQSARDVAHDRNDLLHDITAGASGSSSQQIPHRSADLRLSVIRARKFPIVLIGHSGASHALPERYFWEAKPDEI